MAQLEPLEVVEDDGSKFVLSEVFGWEPYHRIDKRRESRKLLQCMVDEATFFLPGVLALLGYGHLRSWNIDGWLVLPILVVELLCLIGIFFLIIIYADFARGK